MQDGWIKLYRKSLNSRVFKNRDLWQLWTWCLMKATHKKTWVSVSTGRGETEVELQPGQFIFGRKQAAQELKAKPFSTYKRMLKLKKLGNLDIQSNTHFSIVTICNWDKYQAQEIEKEQAKEQPRNNQGTTKEQPRNTNKNDKNEKNEKNNNTPPKVPPKGDEYTPEFEIFWDAYPKKKSKGTAFKAWKKIKRVKSLLPQILKAIETQKKTVDWQKDNGQYIPYPATWLNGRRWEDEVEVKIENKTPAPEEPDPPYWQPIEIDKTPGSPPTKEFEEFLEKLKKGG